MSNTKNINEVSIITTVDSGDYVMVSDISDDSLKRATVTKVGEKLLGTTDISACSADGTVTGGVKAACDGVDELDTAMGSTNISTIGDGTVTGAISALKDSLDEYEYSFTTSTAGIAGVAEQLANVYANLPTYKTLMGIVVAGTAVYHFVGIKASANYATFIVQSSYAANANWHLTFRAGTTWYYAPFTMGAETSI